MAENIELNLIDRLMKLRSIGLGSEITSQSVSATVGQLTELQLRSSTAPIKLAISCPGGSFHAAVVLCDFMDHVITAPLHGIVVGGCHSAATLVLLSCTVRKCTPHASFVLHNATTNGIEIRHDRLSEKTIHDLHTELQGITAAILHIYMQKLRLSKKQVMQLLERGDQSYNRALSAQEALDIGLVHEIVDGKLDIFPTT